MTSDTLTSLSQIRSGMLQQGMVYGKIFSLDVKRCESRLISNYSSNNMPTYGFRRTNILETGPRKVDQA